MANVGKKTIEGIVVLLKKNVLDFNDLSASVLDRVHELLGQNVTLQLISASRSDHQSSGVSSTSSSSPMTRIWSHVFRLACCVSMTEERSSRENIGKPAKLESWNTTVAPLTIGETSYKVTFEWDEDMEAPGAFIVQNKHHSEFYLKTLTLYDVPGHGKVHFVCNSWVYPTKRYAKDRVFFTNKAYLPGETPEYLRLYRQEELEILRGDKTNLEILRGDKTDPMLQEWDRVYDYAFYNDLGDPDKNVDDARPVLGGSSEYPYPRRGRTGRPRTNSDPNTESRLPLPMSLSIYVPRDERFGHLKLSDFLAYGLKSIVQFLVPEFKALFDSTFDEFDSFEDVFKIYEGGFKLPRGANVDNITDKIHLEMFKILLETDDNTGVARYPKPQIIQKDNYAWKEDAEFAREMLAGVNPVKISLLKEFPPTSKLDVQVYGNQNSSIERHHIEQNLNGLKVEEVLKANRLFILDHHDSLMPYLRRINEGVNKIYASRTLLLLQEDGTLIPLAIELSLPHPDGDNFGPVSNVYTPAKEGVEASVWQLAKAYVAVNDSGIHQLISHWLNTHAVVEPFVIAANRQLSVLHPIYKLLYPHFRDTMNINAFARQILINGGGILEKTVFPGKYSMELSSMLYKDWVFHEQALPVDLVKRGMAVEDSNSHHGIRLLIEDYPYAVDGLEIWSAIKAWVEDYCKFYYTNDDMVKNDVELQSWWKELREEGHGDNESWWPKMDSCQELIDICTTFIWVASALHAAVNYGQYPYAGFLPNRPTLSRRFMPEPNTPEYDELKQNPEKVFLKTITPQLQTLLGIALIELLSRHTSDEVYLGQRECPGWTLDEEPLKAFEEFGNKLKEIQERINEMNNDPRMKNRYGLAKVPYTLLYPTSEKGLTGMGIPNSTAM